MADDGVWRTIGFSVDTGARVRSVYQGDGSAFPGFEQPVVGWLTQEEVTADGVPGATRVIAGVLDNRAGVRQADYTADFLYLRHLDDPKRSGPRAQRGPSEEPYGD